MSGAFLQIIVEKNIAERRIWWRKNNKAVAEIGIQIYARTRLIVVFLWKNIKNKKSTGYLKWLYFKV